MKRCPYCDASNEENLENCKVCGQRMDLKIDFDEPVRQLSQVTTQIMKKEIPHSRDVLEQVYSRIMESIQLVLDQSMLQLHDNLKDLKDLEAETSENLEEADFLAFQQFITDFEQAQEKINMGMQYARDTFFSAKTFQDLEKGHLDLSEAAKVISEGLNSIEQLTVKTKDPELMMMQPLHMPPGVDRAIGYLDGMITDLNDYTESGESRFIMSALQRLEQVRVNLEKVMQSSMEKSLQSTIQSTLQEALTAVVTADDLPMPGFDDYDDDDEAEDYQEESDGEHNEYNPEGIYNDEEKQAPGKYGRDNNFPDDEPESDKQEFPIKDITI